MLLALALLCMFLAGAFLGPRIATACGDKFHRWIYGP
jgi:uncharacterized membrane protein YfcA